MAIGPSERPFSWKLSQLRAREHLTYNRMASRSGEARSFTWFQQLLTSSDPWGATWRSSKIQPPGPETWGGLAALLGVDEETVRWWIAQEWFKLKEGRMTSRVRSMAAEIDMLSEADATLVSELLKGLNRQRRQRQQESEAEFEAKLAAIKSEAPPAA